MTTETTSVISVISKGGARGGRTAAMDALKLWGNCAVGGADYSMLPFNSAGEFVRLRAAVAGFMAAVEALEYWDAERETEFQQKKWHLDARDTLTKAAGHLLAACKEVERSDQADAWFEKLDEVVVFEWQGTWTQGRKIRVEVHFYDQLKVDLDWDTATGRESTYLSLPSMTDEADKAEGRREGGWTARATT